MTKAERIFISSKPIAFIREKSKKNSFPGFQGLPLYDVCHRFIKQIDKEGLNVRAAAISFNFLMAIPAVTLFLCTLIPYLPISKLIFNELIKVVSDLTPNKATQTLMNNFLDDFFHKPKRGLLSISFVLTLFYSSNAMMGLIRNFDRSIAIKHHSNFLHKRWRALQLTLLLVLLILGSLLISLGQGMLFKSLMQSMHITRLQTRHLIQNLRWVIIILLFLYSIAFIYKYAPSVRNRGRLLSPGTIFATVLILLTTWLFSGWAQNFSTYNKFYGPIGTLLILMLLTFVNSYVLLIGFELNVSIANLKSEGK